MRKALAFSTASALRAVLLGGVLSAIFAGPACTRQTFDLLQDATGGAGAGMLGAGAGGSVAGNSGHDFGGGGSAGDGRAGAPSSGGVAGEMTMPTAGGGNQEPCLSGDPCTDGGLNCPPTVGYCKRCTTNIDCEGSPARFCDVADGRCAECRLHADDCAPGEMCHPLTLRCMHACKTSADCVNQDHEPQCDPFGACVACNDASDCRQLTGHPNDVCVFGACEECYDNRQCPMERPFCVGLRCQTKP